MTTNQERAEWAEEALQIFGDTTMGGELSEDTMSDLICDICHFAELRLGLRKEQVVRILEGAIGAWSAERSSLDGEPDGNHDVKITIFRF